MKRDAISGVLWLVPARAVQALAHFGGIFVLARYYLDTSEFGIAMLALAVTGFFSAGADWGMGVLNVQREAIDDRRAARHAAIAGLLAALAVALAAPWLARLLGDPAGLTDLIRAAAAALLFAGVMASARARLTRALSFRSLARIDVAVALAMTCGRIGFAMAGFGAWSIVLGDLAAAGFGAALTWFVAPAMRAGPCAPLLADGTRIVGARAADSAFAQADRFLIGRGLGAGALGLYGFAWQHAMVVVSQLTPVAEQIALPIFSRVQNDRPALADAYLALTRIFALVVVPAAGLLHWMAPWLVETLYPERWHGSVRVMRALCVAAAAAGVNSHPGLVWLARGRMRLRLRWSLCNLVALVGVVCVGLAYGIVGVAHALAVRSLLATVSAQLLTNRVAGVGHARYAKALVPGVAIGLVFFALSF